MWDMFSRCSECGALWDITICLVTKKPLCIECCDVECQDRFACWGRYW